MRPLLVTTTSLLLWSACGEAPAKPAAQGESAKVKAPEAAPKPVKAPPAESSVEAKAGLAKLVAAQTTFFDTAQVEEGKPPHRCATLADGSANSGVLPPLTVKCDQGPEGRCVPSESPKEVWEYDRELWAQNGVFAGLDFAIDAPHRFHYSVLAKNSAGSNPEYGACQFTAQAFGDLDADSEFSTFERAADGDGEAMQSGLGIFVDKELE